MNILMMGKKMDLVEIDTGVAGGTKNWSTRLFFGAFNHLHISDFKKYLQSLPWEYPSYVQLIVGEEENDGLFAIHSIYK